MVKNYFRFVNIQSNFLEDKLNRSRGIHSCLYILAESLYAGIKTTTKYTAIPRNLFMLCCHRCKQHRVTRAKSIDNTINALRVLWLTWSYSSQSYVGNSRSPTTITMETVDKTPKGSGDSHQSMGRLSERTQDQAK